MQPRLFAIIQCSMAENGAEVMGLHPSLVRLGYPEFFGNAIEALKNNRVHGVIVHCPRGLVDGRQALCTRKARESRPEVAHLRLEELRDSLATVATHCNEVILYEGPPPPWFRYLPARTQHALLDDEFEGADRVCHHMLIDGNGDAQPGDERTALMDALDERNPAPRWQMPYAGVETMATVNAPHNGPRLSFTLAGRALNANGWDMRTGAFDPDSVTFGNDAAHPKFAPYSAITGERIVLDLHDGDPQTLIRRAAKMASAGFSICVPHWQLNRNAASYQHGFFFELGAATPAPAEPKDEPQPEPKKDPPVVEPKKDAPAAPPHKPWAKAQPTAATGAM